MILALDEAGRRDALEKLLVMQRADMTELFRIMDGLPVTVRLLDPPLHEFVPHSEAEMASVAQAAKVPIDRVRRRVSELSEANPMLGHRGCRLAVTYPEICEMQARAVFEAAIEAGRLSKSGRQPTAEVMVPLVATVKEIEMLKEVIERTAEKVKAERGAELSYSIGTMIELPRAALQAGRIAGTTEFFSFGTNDLTQTTWGLSRDDAGSFLPEYKAKGIVEQDPFVSLDQEGVGELLRMATERGRGVKPKLKVGICGEHGGDPSSIEFCESIGLDYVSCSPFRVPIARLAAAQASMRARGKQPAAGDAAGANTAPAGGA
jgi:pyruvate,orthophosphate dikinase